MEPGKTLKICYYVLQAITAGFIIAGVIRHWNDFTLEEPVPLNGVAY